MRFRSLFVIGLLSATFAAQASHLTPVAKHVRRADPEVEKLLSEMRDAYKNVKTASYDVSTNVYPGSEKKNFKVTMQYKSPEMFKGVVKDGSPKGDVTVTRNDKRIRIVVGSEEPVVADYDPEQFPLSPVTNLESMCFWDWKRQLSTDEGANMHDSELSITNDVSWNDKKWTVLEETARAQEVFVKYYIDPKTHLIWQTVVSKLDDKTSILQEAEITRLDLDKDIDDSEFKVE